MAQQHQHKLYCAKANTIKEYFNVLVKVKKTSEEKRKEGERERDRERERERERNALYGALVSLSCFSPPSISLLFINMREARRRNC